MLTASNLNGVRHGFFTRKGGVSADGIGDMDGLNCGFGSDDSSENVAENRRLAVARLGVQGCDLVTAYQVHSAKVVRVTQAWAHQDAPQVDAMVTGESGMVLGILTADCAPVLFADRTAGIIGAAHAGWRGARAGVVEACIAEMVAIGARPSNIDAAIGPCIAQSSYEVGPEFYQDFIDEDAAHDDFFKTATRPGHFQFDLSGYIERRLSRLELASVAALGVDTCGDPERFYSYRRCTLNGEKDYGRLLSAIVLEQPALK
ncbi:MAG: peptidoglycan editing factor PgeF [Rhodospirillales bacterium]|nr:peptidoglycan editing factor PgeF [Rhodospirillales bacterium]